MERYFIFEVFSYFSYSQDSADKVKFSNLKFGVIWMNFLNKKIYNQINILLPEFSKN